MRSIPRTVSFCLLILLSTTTLFAQYDADPNSPSPVLVSAGDSDRVLAEGRDLLGARRGIMTDRFVPSSSTEVTLYIRGLDLLPHEGVNSIRVYVYQRSGRTFELRNVALTLVDKRTHALKVILADKDGFRGQLLADGESIVFLTWRGLRSNYLKIQLGDSRNAIEAPKYLLEQKRSSKDEPSSEYVGYRWSGDRKRFLEQATFGPSAIDDFRLRRVGPKTWLNEQFEKPYPTLPYPDIQQRTTTPSTDCQLTTFPTCYREHYTMMPLQKWFFMESFYGEAQLRHRVAWALSQIWVTSGLTVQQSSHQIAYFKTLADNSFGNYRDIMRAVTLNPAMGHYLDMVRSTKLNPNENYPREILQLFSIGLYKLNQDGTLQLDNNGQPIDTYDQAVINDLSKVFTGWTFCNVGCSNSRPSIVNYKDPMVINPANHDLTAKTLLDYPNSVHREIAACTNCTDPDATKQYAEESLNRAIDNIFNHPNVGPFIGKLLIQHLVTSDPSPAYVERVAAAFSDNGRGERGDMKAVIRAVLLDPEARGDLKTAPRYGKLREPVQLISNLGRIFPARDFAGTSLSDGGLASYSAKLGQNPFNSPTVFNYFSPFYIVPGTTVLGPEFEILNSGAAVNRTNLLHTLIFEGVTANAIDALRGTSLDISEFVPFAESDETGQFLVEMLNKKMLHSALSDEHRTAIISAVQAVPSTNSPLRVRTAVYLIAASSQYQIQR